MAAPDFPLINHVFVLMLENHSFDHLLGFSGITGGDAVTGKPTQINGLQGRESNLFNKVTYSVQQPAPFSMPIDPGHEFTDTLLQLTGSNQPYDPAKGYPGITCSGFVDDYVNSLTPGEGHAGSNYGDIMKCFGPEQLPVLNALAREFAVCDNWFSSMPGPTWPNRFFIHAGSSGGLDHSPTTAEILAWENIGGVNFQNGTIFDQLGQKFSSPYRLYRGNNFLSDNFPNVAALKGINALNCHSITDFASDVSGEYDWPYTFIEPSYGDVLNNTYRGGTSQHPLDDVTGGERLIKQVYETIRNSALWEKSLLIVLWDEHGGFYDHVAPPAAAAPGDRIAAGSMNKYGFDFKQYGVRVPAVVVSPLITKNTIDHRLYDHASVPRTLQELFSLSPMTSRDGLAGSLLPLLLLRNSPRTDCITTLPSPVQTNMAMTAPDEIAQVAIPANHGSLPGFLHAALKTDLDLSPPAQHEAIKAQFAAIHTQQDARAYMDKVQRKMQSQAGHK
jgi:phospholipase C